MNHLHMMGHPDEADAHGDPSLAKVCGELLRERIAARRKRMNCRMCVKAVVEEGLGDPGSIEVATEKRQVDGETWDVCGQCAEVIDENIAIA